MNNILEQLSLTFGGFVGGLIGAVVLLIIAYAIGSLLRGLVNQIGRRTQLDQRVRSQGLTKTLGNVAFWLTFLFFLPGILQGLGLTSILLPVQQLLANFFDFLPRLIGAIVIGVVGYFVAKIVRQIVTGLLSAVGVDRFATRLGLNLGGQSLSNILGLVVYVLILLPVIVAALDALNLPGITQPISAMLNTILLSIPRIFAAVVLLAITYAIGRVLANIVADLLRGVGFNALTTRLGVRTAAVAQPGRTPSDIVGYVVLVTIMLFASIEAFNLLGLNSVADILRQFIVLMGRVLVGLIVFAIGYFLANLAYRTLQSSGQPSLVAQVARVAILVLAGAMGLQQMGIADSIINLAFGLTLGAIAVAAALAFGLGGRDAAAQVLDQAKSSPRVQQALTQAATPQPRSSTQPLTPPAATPTRRLDPEPPTQS